VAAAYLGGQVKKPDRFAGRLFAGLMNGSHALLTDWALTHIKMAADAIALNVACGGGNTISAKPQRRNQIRCALSIQL